MSSVKFFQENNYVIINNFLSEQQCNTYYNYTKLLANRNAIKYELEPDKYDKYWDGDWNDPQAIGSYSQYGDPLMDTLLVQSLETMKSITGLDLIATYAYFRLYTEGDTLDKHIDRPSCEISTTLCLGENSTNLNYDYTWPIYMQRQGGDFEPVRADLRPGDMIVYRGQELVHWRDELKGLNQSQVFLHYNDKNGEHNIQMDGRPMFGLPKTAQYRY